MVKIIDGIEIEVDPVDLANPTLSFLCTYWKNKRGSRAMPARCDIRPADLREHLGWVNMVDVLPGVQNFRYRLIGTFVTQYFSAESTGKTVKEAFATWDEAVRDCVLDVFQHTTTSRKAILARGREDVLAPGFEKFTSLFLPLSDDGQNVNVIINAFVFDRPQVLMARQIAMANGGRLTPRPPPHHPLPQTILTH